jgi:spore germination cell wall hydrolase CwlJ-like protein
MEARARPEVLGAMILAGFALLLAIGLAVFYLVASHPARRTASAVTAVVPPPIKPLALPTPAAPADMTQALIDPAQLRPVSPEEAIAYNASVPISTEPNPPARPFLLAKASAQDIARAEDCLTAAVYYEASTEPDAGQRAVAQAVLNRTRHFAYPKTVCGIVFQGSERTTGCQFTFTCDGAMARAIIPGLWARARKVALAALGGHVEKSVGYATHYHADYVAPYWQPTLIKVAVIGHHIFYRGADGWGRPTAFTSPYAGGEPDVPALTATLAAIQPPTPAPLVMIDPATPASPSGNTAPPITLVPLAPSVAAPEPAGAATPPPPPPVAPKDAEATKRAAKPHAPERPRLPMEQ